MMVAGKARGKRSGGSDGEESAYMSLNPGSEISSGEGNGYPLQYFYLENLINRVA